jgi:hypothetical protein
MSRVFQNPILYQLFEGRKLHVNEYIANRNSISVEPQTRGEKKLIMICSHMKISVGQFTGLCLLNCVPYHTQLLCVLFVWIVVPS